MSDGVRAEEAAARPFGKAFDDLIGRGQVPADLISFLDHYRALPRDGIVPSLDAFLDNPPYAFMSRLAIADMTAREDFTIRFFGTELVALCGADLTGRAARESEREGVRMQVGGRGWRAVTQPCGYLSRRAIYRRGHTGIADTRFEIVTLSLPLSRPAPAAQCMLNFNSIPEIKFERDGTTLQFVLQTIDFVAWIDLGAGTPDDD